jgi:hypothetical protein
MANLDGLKVKIFADGAEKQTMLDLYANPLIRGFTTNPTLMRKAGIKNYEWFARDILDAIPDRPISFEVFADEFDDMEEQARHIATWSDNVYVKIPVTNTKRESCCSLVRELNQARLRPPRRRFRLRPPRPLRFNHPVGRWPCSQKHCRRNRSGANATWVTSRWAALPART